MRPHYVSRPWGGSQLARVLGRDDLPRGPVGESWEVADVDEHVSLVEEGPLRGQTLRQAFGRPFPLLVKVLDAADDLSVQVHPDGLDGTKAKEEAWVALADGARVALGRIDARAPPRPGRWLEALERLTLLGPGEGVPPSMVHVPPGTVHAVFGGSLLWEVQNPVDVTWRLDDHGRLGLDGRPRPLHLLQAGRLLARGPQPASAAAAVEEGLLLTAARFWVRCLPAGVAQPTHGALVAFFLAGGDVAWCDARDRPRRLVVPRGRTAVLTPSATALGSTGWILLAGVPSQTADA